MGEDQKLNAQVAENKVRSDRNTSDIRDLVLEIRAIPCEIKKIVKEEFSNHQFVHNAIEKKSAEREDVISKLVAQMAQIEKLVIKIKANWKIVSGGFTVMLGFFVWAINKSIDLLFS